MPPLPRRRGPITAMLALVLAVSFATTACSSSNKKTKGTTPISANALPPVVNEGAHSDRTSRDGQLTIETTSARAAFVSGGDVLVTVRGAALAGGSPLHVTRNGVDVTSVFAKTGTERRGLVRGLRDNDNTLSASAGGSVVTLPVVNHPIDGPMFAGPHLTPWICTTVAAGLGPATDNNCDAPTKTTWSYRSTSGDVKPLDPPTARPADLAHITVNGTSVPFIMRQEEGVIDRGIYWIWVLDPNAGAPGPWKPVAWNQRLVYRFGGGCGTSYSQGSTLAVTIDPDLLARGYALATNTLDTFQTACNDVLSAEAAMMTREHFVKAYGVPRFTIGDGGSGGAIQQLLIAYNYPGLLDALSPALPFPDAVSIAGGVTDCGLLVHYYATSHGSSLTTTQRAAINGHASPGTCVAWNQLFVGGVNPTDGCDPAIPKAEIYNATTNRKGVRCTLADSNVGVLGRDPATGFANRPLDNAGIQYGLQALNDHVITPAQFIDLNQYIGGYDIDGNIVAARATMSPSIAAQVYRTGRVTQAGALEDVPIVLRNIDTDTLGDIHTRVQPFAIRDRLKVGGHDDPNLLLWTSPGSGGNLVSNLLGNAGGANAPIVLLDAWLTNLAKTNPALPAAQRLVAAKPAGAKNQCVLPDGKVLTGGWELYDEPGPCRDAFPVHEDPRIVAGAPQRQDAVKCTLKPVDMHDYKVTFTAAQREQLTKIFPTGVCDWTKPGVGQQPLDATWKVYPG